jgi:uncharacterized protein YdeI (BOF family)
MRKTLIFTLVLCVVAVFAYAQTGGGSTGGTGSTATTGSTGGATTGTTTTTTTTTTKAKGKHAAHNKSVKGTVASVDQAGKSFVVHPAKGADVTVKVNDKTKYTPKTKCSWDDIKVDGKVTVTYKNDGTDNWAITVHCWPEKKAAASKAPKTTGR